MTVTTSSFLRRGAETADLLHHNFLTGNFISGAFLPGTFLSNKSVTGIIATLVLLLMGCAGGGTTALVKSVTPSRVTMRIPTVVTAKLNSLNANDQVFLSPGGPYATQTLSNIGRVTHITTDGEHIFAAGGDDTLRVIQFNKNNNHIIVEQSFAHPIDMVKVIERTLYVAEDQVGLHVFNIGEDGSLIANGDFHMAEPIRQIAAADNGLFLLSSHRTLTFIKRQAGGTLQEVATTLLPTRIHDFVIQGSRGYFSGPSIGVGIYDMHDPTQLTQLGHFTTSGSGERLVIHDNRAYVADGMRGMTVLDVHDPTHIRWLGSHNKLGEVRAVAVIGKRAIVDNAGLRLASINITSDALPITGSFYKTGSPINDFITVKSNVGNIVYAATDKGIERVDYSTEAKVQISNEGINLGGSRRAFIKDNIAYVADWFSGLHIYDISIPNAPRQIGNYHTKGSSKGVFVKGHYAFVGDDDDGLQIIDVADPRHPFKVAGIASSGLAYTLKVIGNRVYLADHRGGFHIFDVSDIRHPKDIAHYKTPGKSWAIAVDGHTGYVADDTSGLLTFDFSNPSKPKLLGRFDPKGYAEDVLIKDKIAFVSFFDKGLYILDVHHPAHPKELAHLPIPGNARSIKIEGHYAYIAGWESGLQVVDISNLTQPRIVSYFDTSGSAWGANIYHGYAYVWDWWGGVKVIDVHDPLHPRFAGQYQARSKIEQLAREGKFLFSANGSNGMQVFDINNPLNPIWATGVDFTGYARAIATTPTHAYVTTDDAGIQIVDIHNPFQSAWRSVFNTPQAITTLRSAGDMLYGINTSGELLSIDIHQPEQPVLFDRKRVQATDLWVNSDKVFVSTREQQLLSFAIGKDNNLGRLQLHNRYNAPFAIQHVTANATLVAISGRDGTVQLLTRHVLSRQGDMLTPLSQFHFCNTITQMRFDGAQLLIFDQKRGLLTVQLDDPIKPRLTVEYPATGLHQGFVATHNAVFFSGESTIASVDLLPKVPQQPIGSDTIKLSIPVDMPLGSYHLITRNMVGAETRLGNAFKVALPKHNSHKFTMEDFKKIVRQQKDDAPH